MMKKFALVFCCLSMTGQAAVVDEFKNQFYKTPEEMAQFLEENEQAIINDIHMVGFSFQLIKTDDTPVEKWAYVMKEFVALLKSQSKEDVIVRLKDIDQTQFDGLCGRIEATLGDKDDAQQFLNN